jgi:hypothetical protein
VFELSETKLIAGFIEFYNITNRANFGPDKIAGFLGAPKDPFQPRLLKGSFRIRRRFTFTIFKTFSRSSESGV